MQRRDTMTSSSRMNSCTTPRVANTHPQKRIYLESRGFERSDRGRRGYAKAVSPVVKCNAISLCLAFAQEPFLELSRDGGREVTLLSFLWGILRPQQHRFRLHSGIA
ncbi:hypothetical protein NDU88_007403 [Pleurodeles waltl]|uniref:Uncharacterized protein n=1 Tax=Pleurodeles waltl TaxID=8319 RepID=A0AAV7PP59_PLEWA|nr:hypothetical protein NDU88_007403 [Pleurodeles waltl]